MDNQDSLSVGMAALRRAVDAVAIEVERMQDAPAPNSVVPFRDNSLVEIARRLLASRTAIGQIFDPTLFADPATNILLKLYVDTHGGDVTTTGACCKVAAVPRTTALRLITLLCGRGLTETYELPSDRRSTLIRLTPSGTANVDTLLDQIRYLFYQS